MHITGGCHCGAIRYEADVNPETCSLCHCTDCQVLSGSAFRYSVRAEAGSFHLLAGKPRVYVKIAESGRPREQTFCENCGSNIYAANPGPEPRVVTLRVGSIDQRAELRPKLQIWMRSALPWTDHLAEVPKLEKQQP